MDNAKPISGIEFGNQKLRDTIKCMCKDFGLTTVSQLAISKLAAVLRSTLCEYAHNTRLMTENAGRTQANVHDVLAALKLSKVNEIDFMEYSKKMRCERLHALPIFPVPDRDIMSSDETFFEAMYGPKASDRELEERKEHIPPYLRAMHPNWIDDENKEKQSGKVVKRVVKTAADKEQDEFNKLKRINTYRRNETPEAQKAREDKEKREAEEAVYNKKRNKERFDLGITAFAESDLPNFEDMDYNAMGFFKDYEEAKRLEAERIQEALDNKQNAMPVKPIISVPPPTAPAVLPPLGDWQTATSVTEWNVAPVSVSSDTNLVTVQLTPDVVQTDTSAITVADSSFVSTTSTEDAGPTFKMSDLVKSSKPLLKVSGTNSNPGSAPSSRPPSSLEAAAPKKQFGPGRPKKPKPEGVVPQQPSVPKPKGRPPKKATLEKRKRLSDQIIAQQQKKLDEFKDDKEKSEKSEKPEKPEKAEKVEKKSRKPTLVEEIRDQLLRARSNMVLPNSVLAQQATSQLATPQESSHTAPSVTAYMEPAYNVPPVAATCEIVEENMMDDPAMEVEIRTDDVNAESYTVNPESSFDNSEVKEKKHKKEKRDKNSEEYKEYKRQKKERRRREREERKESEKVNEEVKEEESTPVKVPDRSLIVKIPKYPMNEPAPVPIPTPKPPIKLKIKFGSTYLPTPTKLSPMRPEPTTSSGSRPTSSKSNYQDDPPPPPANPPPLKFRFKNLFNLGERKEEKKDIETSSDSYRPDSSLRVESPSSSSTKHHKKDKKDKEHKKHKKDKKDKKDKERDREKDREREERKERERQKEDAARREIEEKAREEMDARRIADEAEEQRRREKEKRREEKKKEKERQKEKEDRHREKEERHREKEERRERKERERELEREHEREKELEREREKAREREREKEREKERERERERERRKEEEEAQRRREEAVPARPLISQEDDDSNGSDSSEEIWICPVCSVAYTVGANMVGCDMCQDWFHWHCVGITAEPTDSKWFCNRCSKGNKSKKHGKRHAGGPHASESSSKRKKN